MTNRVSEFFSRNAIGMMITAGLVGAGVLVLNDKWEEEQERNALLDKIAAADVTQTVCPAKKPVTDLTLTLAPLFEIEDRMMRKNGEDLLRHVTKHGISFAFCPMAFSTTSYEVIADPVGRYLSVVKINGIATVQEQQAAVLQFLKEYKSASISIHYNNMVQASPGLSKVMPGRLPPGTDPKTHNLGQYGITLDVPSR